MGSQTKRRMKRDNSLFRQYFHHWTSYEDGSRDVLKIFREGVRESGQGWNWISTERTDIQAVQPLVHWELPKRTHFLYMAINTVAKVFIDNIKNVLFLSNYGTISTIPNVQAVGPRVNSGFQKILEISSVVVLIPALLNLQHGWDI